MHRILDAQAGVLVPPGLCALGIMTKAPRAGRVKTRLTPPLSPEEAAALNTCFLRDTASAILTAVVQDNGRAIAVYTPAGEERAYADILPAEFELVLQRGDKFGERLVLAMEDLFRLGFNAACLIDSDSPTVPEENYAKAIRLLRPAGDRMILGPSEDGGYYLIGLKQPHRRLFEDIDWSTEHVAAQTIARAHEIGLAVEFLTTCYDVDDRVALRRLRDELNEGGVAPATRAFLAQLEPSNDPH